MYWNHRAMSRTVHGETALYIVEVYYNSSDHSIIGWTDNDGAWAEDLDGLREVLSWMTSALDKPVLDEADLLAQCERLKEMGADAHEVGLQENGGEVL